MTKRERKYLIRHKIKRITNRYVKRLKELGFDDKVQSGKATLIDINEVCGYQDRVIKPTVHIMLDDLLKNLNTAKIQ